MALGLMTYPLTVLWVVAVTNTVNLVDGVDGLAGGIVFIALSTLVAVRLIHPQAQDSQALGNVLIMSASLMGAIISFLQHNMFPASIFMGDSGAYFLGFMVAGLSILGSAKGSILLVLGVPVISLGLPLSDVCFAILRRYIRKVPIFQADKEHVHHVLLRHGFDQSETTRLLWMASACLGLLAILASGISHQGIKNLVLMLVILTALGCVNLFIGKFKRDV